MKLDNSIISCVFLCFPLFAMHIPFLDLLLFFSLLFLFALLVNLSSLATCRFLFCGIVSWLLPTKETKSRKVIQRNVFFFFCIVGLNSYCGFSLSSDCPSGHPSPLSRRWAPATPQFRKKFYSKGFLNRVALKGVERKCHPLLRLQLFGRGKNLRLSAF